TKKLVCRREAIGTLCNSVSGLRGRCVWVIEEIDVHHSRGPATRTKGDRKARVLRACGIRHVAGWDRCAARKRDKRQAEKDLPDHHTFAPEGFTAGEHVRNCMAAGSHAPCRPRLQPSVI